MQAETKFDLHTNNKPVLPKPALAANCILGVVHRLKRSDM
jgi:hypothetical protein